MEKLSHLAFHPVKMQSCYEKMDQLKLEGLQQRFDVSSTSVFKQRAQIHMRQVGWGPGPSPVPLGWEQRFGEPRLLQPRLGCLWWMMEPLWSGAHGGLGHPGTAVPLPLSPLAPAGPVSQSGV